MTPPVLTTERLRLRPHTMDDWEPMAAFFASDRSRFVGGPLSRDSAWYGFAADVGSWSLLGFGGLAIEDRATGAFLGQVSFNQPPHSPAKELGWLLMPGAEGMGLAYEAAVAARAYAYEALDWPGVVSFIAPDNVRSLALAQRLGAIYDPHTPSISEDRGVFRHPPPEGARMIDAEAIRRAADLLRGHRESIDRLDAILVYTLAERFKHTQAVGVLKAAHKLPPSDPAREASQIARLERLAEDADLDPEFATKFLNFIISEVIRHHESHLEDGPGMGQSTSMNRS